MTGSRGAQRESYFTTYFRNEAIEKAVIRADSAESEYADSFNTVEMFHKTFESPDTQRGLQRRIDNRLLGEDLKFCLVVFKMFQTKPAQTIIFRGILSLHDPAQLPSPL